MKEHKSRLMMELEQEKKRLEEDIASLNKNSVSSHSHSVCRREGGCGLVYAGGREGGCGPVCAGGRVCRREGGCGPGP